MGYNMLIIKRIISHKCFIGFLASRKRPEYQNCPNYRRDDQEREHEGLESPDGMIPLVRGQASTSQRVWHAEACPHGFPHCRGTLQFFLDESDDLHLDVLLLRRPADDLPAGGDREERPASMRNHGCPVVI